MRCADCMFFEPANGFPSAGFGHCSRWKQGYDVSGMSFQANDVLVENDEGWGCYVGPDFGCVLFEVKP